MKLCGFDIGLDRPFFLIAGPCVLEGEQMAVDIASAMKDKKSLQKEMEKAEARFQIL